MADRGTGDKVRGAIKGVIGKVTGDERIEAEGRADQAKGDAKHRVHDAKGSVKGVGDSLVKE